MDEATKYPKIKVKLLGSDGNAFSILAKVQKAMRTAGISQAEVSTFHQEATSGNYDHLLQTCMKWVRVS